ncbi:MAG: 50S ribosomal protein L17 [Parcubacteria group bacterium GW2011_GWA2_46_7]|nr:MAG: 50S ribosomal protein L17 [Parcubacteria group bacterium GW2011_GWF1_45_5]KKU10522.1 MAG: 50S ribosomal protein L17 [Parcubacteria group bacterium GW2011_GWA1_45_7]KKU44181.1 MAG: 50S ribosomal protein L17 [Parcubacteria group bacterium GW2011_GWA2_46_7]KKU47351.1 MAG: 50S ribosomal protein L17 [Parcubacteria group bacterium GW2011_GWF2_46_8]
MRHKKEGKKFGRERGDRKAFIKGLVHNLVMKEHITTTLVRAKELARVCSPHITMGKTQTLASYRKLLARLPQKSAEKIFKDLGVRFKDRHGGYTRITKLNRRNDDGAPMARIEFVQEK